jgi:AAA domain
LIAAAKVEKALATVGALFEPGDVIEIRALNVGRTPTFGGSTHSGYFEFEAKDAIITALKELDGRAEGIYVVLNPLNRSLLARAKNRLQAKPKNTTADADIIKWRWLYIDCDPVRPAGISSTDAEHDAALERAGQIRDFFAGRGWPEPIYSDSGNGAHLLYRLPDLELDRAAVLVKACLKALAQRFSDPAVQVDESTSNASRICKLYGTQTRKGDAIPDRPHRYSCILEEPERAIPVPVAALEALAAEVATAAPISAEQSRTSIAGTFKVDAWLATNGLDVVKGPEPYEGGRRWILRLCPFDPTHEKAAIIELSNGALAYRCLHNSCVQFDWKAFRGRIEPGYQSAVREGKEAPLSTTPLITDLSQLPGVWSLEQTLLWSVENMIAQGSVTLICAESGVGKTWLGYYIAGCVAHGIPVAGRCAKQSKALYLDGENPLYVVKQRLLDLGIAETGELTIWGGWNLSPPVGPQSPLVVEFAKQWKPVIIFDSLIEFHPGSEQSSTETRAFMKHFRLLANFGATVIVLHHSGKAETAKIYRGSSDIKAAVDTAYQLQSVGEESNQLGQLSMKCFKGRLVPGQSFGLEFRQGQGFVASEAASKGRTVTEVIAEILTEYPRSNQSKVIKLGQSRGCSKGQIEQALMAGPWLTEHGAKNSTLYSLAAHSEAGDEDQN